MHRTLRQRRGSRFGNLFPQGRFRLSRGNFGVLAGDIAIFTSGRIQTKIVADLFRDIFVNRTGVSLLFGNAELGQELKHPLRLDLKLPGQFIDPNLLHTLERQQKSPRQGALRAPCPISPDLSSYQIRHSRLHSPGLPRSFRPPLPNAPPPPRPLP